MPKITTIKLSDDLDARLEKVREEINFIKRPLNIKRQEIIFHALEAFLKKPVYQEYFGIKKRSQGPAKPVTEITPQEPPAVAIVSDI
jgi:hypothetical protein